MENDYANGIFSFDGLCSPTSTDENKNITCAIKRKISTFGQVEVKWMTNSFNTSLYSQPGLIPSNGSIFFNEGQRTNVKMFIIEQTKTFFTLSSNF